MPHSQYVATRYPPSILDRLLMGSFSVPLSLLSLVVGVQIAMTMFADFHVSRGLSESSEYVQFSTAALLFMGGILSLLGTFNPGCKLDKLKAMTVRRAGTTGLTAGWLTFSFVVILTGNQYGVITAELSLALSASFALYSVSTWIRERQVGKALEVENGT